jgi:hypothetical protein
LVLAAVVVVVLAFWFRLFMTPATDLVVDADAVVVLPGSGEGGLEAALALVNAQQARTLVIPGGLDESGSAADRLCLGGGPADVVCPTTPGDERGRAMALGALIDERAWDRVALVSGRSTASRDALVVGRCTDAVLLRQVAPDGGGAAVIGGALAAAPRYLISLLLEQSC